MVSAAALQAVPDFSEATFLCSVKNARIAIGGTLEITLEIQPSEKYRAISLTDAVGIQVLIHAERKRRMGLREAMAQGMGDPDD